MSLVTSNPLEGKSQFQKWLFILLEAQPPFATAAKIIVHFFHSTWHLWWLAGTYRRQGGKSLKFSPKKNELSLSPTVLDINNRKQKSKKKECCLHWYQSALLQINSMSTTILYLVSLAALLACTPAESFHSNGVVRPLTTSISLEQEVWKKDNKKGHFKNQNAFPPPLSSSRPSITSYRYSAATSPGPIASSTTRLNSFSSKSFFRTAETTSVDDTATRTPEGVASFGQLISAASSQVSVTAKQQLKSVSQSISALRLPTTALEEVADQLSQFILKYWWSFPLFLALVPVMTTYVLGTGDAIMPHWWPCTKMDHIVGAPDAFMVVGCFLLSNIAYFASGAFLVKKFPFVRPESSPTTTTTNANSRNNNLSDTMKSKLESMRMVPTRQTWLGLLMLSSGLISTIFHTEQALGSYALANSLCYIDHAIAGTATFYFFHTCNAPSKRVWALGIAGLACLSIPHPAYAWLHSTWHFLSAGAATLWALESFDGLGNKNQRPEQTDKKRLVEQITMPQLD